MLKNELAFEISRVKSVQTPFAFYDIQMSRQKSQKIADITHIETKFLSKIFILIFFMIILA